MTCKKRSELLEVTFEIVRVTGPEAEESAIRQAQVIDEVPTVACQPGRGRAAAPGRSRLR